MNTLKSHLLAAKPLLGEALIRLNYKDNLDAAKIGAKPSPTMVGYQCSGPPRGRAPRMRRGCPHVASWGLGPARRSKYRTRVRMDGRQDQRKPSDAANRIGPPPCLTGARSSRPPESLLRVCQGNGPYWDLWKATAPSGSFGASWASITRPPRSCPKPCHSPNVRRLFFQWNTRPFGFANR